MARGQILVVNCGSSSIKFALVDPDTGARKLSALAEGVGAAATAVSVHRGEHSDHESIPHATYDGVIGSLLAMMSSAERASVVGIGHRVVHGGAVHVQPVVVTDAVIDQLEAIIDLAPLQLPANIGGLRAAMAALARTPQVAVFDTAFHATLPPVAYRYAVPTSWYGEHSLRRYGFHGLSHRYVSERAAILLGRSLMDLRLVTLHLGNGCSAAAVRDGVCVDTTMGMTPLEGLVMGTRSGDIDAGALGVIGARTGMDLAAVVHELNVGSGLLGVSGVSSDMRVVAAAAKAGNADATLALDLFCYRAAKAVGALSVPLGRLDAIVFTGGIGEHDADVRRRILELLAVLDVQADDSRNAEHGASSGGLVSSDASNVDALVVPTDEELVIARDTADLVVAALRGSGTPNAG